jgi:hypothetical protein
MITCVVEYVIVPAKIDAFERFGRRWMELVDSRGGMHHGYFLPAEGASAGATWSHYVGGDHYTRPKRGTVQRAKSDAGCGLSL